MNRPKSAKHVYRQLTPAEQIRVAAARLEVEQDKPDILEMAKQYKEEADAERAK